MSRTMEKARRRLREQDGPAAERFLRAFDRARDRLRRITGQSARDMNRLIRDLRNEIAARMAMFTGLPSDPFTVAIIPGLTDEIRVALDEFTRAAGSQITERMDDAFTIGGRVTSSALTAAGLPAFAPIVAPDLLASAAAASTGLVTDITGLLADQITRALQFSALGLEPTSAAIRRVTDLLRMRALVPGFQPRIGFGFQAEAIVRTEIGRIYSTAQQAASEQISTTIPDLRKRWVTTLGRRREHKEAERRYAPGGETGPIPVNRRFEIVDRSRTGLNVQGFWTRFGRVYKGKRRFRRGRVRVFRMLHPRDPRGGAGAVVNCSCVVLEVLPEIERATDRALGILQRGGS